MRTTLALNGLNKQDCPPPPPPPPLKKKKISSTHLHIFDSAYFEKLKLSTILVSLICEITCNNKLLKLETTTTTNTQTKSYVT